MNAAGANLEGFAIVVAILSGGIMIGFTAGYLVFPFWKE